MNDRLVNEIDIECPYCNKEITITIDSIGESVICPHCNQNFETEDNGLADAIEDAENQINDFLENLL